MQQPERRFNASERPVMGILEMHTGADVSEQLQRVGSRGTCQVSSWRRLPEAA